MLVAHYSAIVALPLGSSMRTIVALTMLMLVSAGAWAAEQRIALVIGNSAYADSPLLNPANDAKLMASALREQGFEVMERLDVDQNAMKLAVRDFGNRLKAAQGGAVGLFYYAGHGLQVDGENYLIPVGAPIADEGDVDIFAVGANGILRTLEDARNGLNIVILDACRNNPFARSFRAQVRGLARMDAPQGTLIAYSTAPGQVALDGDGANSPYTAALAKAIGEPGVLVEQMFKRVRIALLDATLGRQTSWEASSLTTDFYLAGAPAVAEPAAVELAFWASIEDSDDPRSYQAYLTQYPDGAFAAIARLRMEALSVTEVAVVRPPAEPQATFAAQLIGDWVSIEEQPYIDLGMTIPVYQMLRFAADGTFVSAYYAPAWPYREGVRFYLDPFVYGHGDPAVVPTQESLLHDPPLRARGRFEIVGQGPTAALRIAISHAAPILPDWPRNPRPALVLDADGSAPSRIVDGYLVIDDPQGVPHRFRRVNWNTLAATRTLLTEAGLSAWQWGGCAEEAAVRLLDDRLPPAAVAIADGIDLVEVFAEIVAFEGIRAHALQAALRAMPTPESLVGDGEALRALVETVDAAAGEIRMADFERQIAISERLRPLAGKYPALLAALCPDGRAAALTRLCRVADDTPDRAIVESLIDSKDVAAILAHYRRPRSLCHCLVERVSTASDDASLAEAQVVMAEGGSLRAGLDRLGLDDAALEPLYESCTAELRE
jgi:hypothetical protein